VLALGVSALGIALGLPAAHLALLLGAIGLVLVTEVFNTAIEAAVDLASPHWHPLARDAKDMAAGAVLVAAIIAALTGLLLLGPPLLAHVASLL
jgi:diacylglycerol kinase